MIKRHVFIMGGTGYLGRALASELAQRGHEVKALVRPGSESKVPARCTSHQGDALDRATFLTAISPADTFVQLVGVAHPSPAKAKKFREIDLVSVQQSVAAAQETAIRHFVYVSVAQPAPMMKAYHAVRAEGEGLIRAAGLNATILRPWYILGPGHRWPYVLLPAYWLAEMLPWTREGARRLGFVTQSQMINALIFAVENPPEGVWVVEVPAIRAKSNFL